MRRVPGPRNYDDISKAIAADNLLAAAQMDHETPLKPPLWSQSKSIVSLQKRLNLRSHAACHRPVAVTVHCIVTAT
jgi:hypothetical protein